METTNVFSMNMSNGLCVVMNVSIMGHERQHHEQQPYLAHITYLPPDTTTELPRPEIGIGFHLLKGGKIFDSQFPHLKGTKCHSGVKGNRISRVLPFQVRSRDHHGGSEAIFRLLRP